MGFKLHSVLEAAGLRCPEVRAEAIVQTPSTSYPRAALIRVLLPKIIELGVATEEEVDIETLEERLQKEMDETQGVAVPLLVFGAWARRPD
jgi:hypothetical protein